MRPATAVKHSAGWLAVLLMLLLSSPGIQVTQAASQAPVAQAASPR